MRLIIDYSGIYAGCPQCGLATVVRAFAHAQGRLAKTDPIDAVVLAEFGRALHPSVRPLPPAQAVQWTERTRRRRQLLQMMTAEQHRLDHASKPLAQTIRTFYTRLCTAGKPKKSP